MSNYYLKKLSHILLIYQEYLSSKTIVYLRAGLSAFNSRHCACRFGVCKGISVNNPAAMIYDARWIFIDKWSRAFCAGSIWYFVVTRRPDRGMTAEAF